MLQLGMPPILVASIEHNHHDWMIYSQLQVECTSRVSPSEGAKARSAAMDGNMFVPPISASKLPQTS